MVRCRGLYLFFCRWISNCSSIVFLKRLYRIVLAPLSKIGCENGKYESFYFCSSFSRLFWLPDHFLLSNFLFTLSRRLTLHLFFWRILLILQDLNQHNFSVEHFVFAFVKMIPLSFKPPPYPNFRKCKNGQTRARRPNPVSYVFFNDPEAKDDFSVWNNYTLSGYISIYLHNSLDFASWPVTPKIFIIGPFKKKFANLCIYPTKYM